MTTETLHKNTKSNHTSPAGDGFAIVPHATNFLTNVARAIYVGVGGTVVLTTKGGTELTFLNVPDGFVLPINTSKVNTTSTATDMIALT